MQQRFGMRFDPLTEIVPLLGSKEGISHLAFAYLEPGKRRRSSPSRATTRTRAARCSRAARRTATRCGRARTSSSSSTRSRDDVLRRARHPVPQLSEQSDGGHRARASISSASCAVPRARHPARVRQRVLRARVRRLRAAEHLRDRRRARRGDRVPLDVEDVQHDGLALRLGRGEARDRRRAGQGEVVRRHGTVHGGAGGGGRGARELRRLRAAQRRRVPGAA